MITTQQVLANIQMCKGQANMKDVADYLGAVICYWDLPFMQTSKLTMKQNHCILTISKQFETNDKMSRFVSAHALAYLALGFFRGHQQMNFSRENYRLPTARQNDLKALEWAIEMLAPQELANPIIQSSINPEMSLIETFGVPLSISSLLVKRARLLG